MVNERYTLIPLLAQPCKRILSLCLDKTCGFISKCITYGKESVNYFQAGLSNLAVQRTAAPTAFSLRDLHKQCGLSGLIAVTLGQISQSYYYPV